MPATTTAVRAALRQSRSGTNGRTRFLSRLRRKRESTVVLARLAGICRPTMSKIINRKDEVSRPVIIAALATMTEEEIEDLGYLELWREVRARVDAAAQPMGEAEGATEEVDSKTE